MRRFFGRYENAPFLNVLKNSGYLILSNLISVFLTVYITRLLGAYAYGVLGIITSYVTNINKFFSFRMNEMVVHFAGDPYARGETRKTGALIKFAAGLEAGTSLFAFLVLIISAKFGAELFLEDPTLSNQVILYGLSILAGGCIETANGVLRIFGEYRSIAWINLLQNGVVLAFVLISGNRGFGLTGILTAYLIGKVLLCVAPVVFMLKLLPRRLGADWFRAPLSLLGEKREILRFTFSTNVSNTINLIARDGEVLWIGALLSPLYAGYYKTAMTIINMVLLPINPFIDTTYPAMVRLIGERKWRDVKRLLANATTVSAAWTGACLIGLVALGRRLLFQPVAFFGLSFQVFSAEFLPSYALILILMIGYGVANVLFWNRTLLLSFEKADTAMWISLAGMGLKVILTLTLVPNAAYPAEAAILSAYLAGTVLWMTWVGLRTLNRAERFSAPERNGMDGGLS